MTHMKVLDTFGFERSMTPNPTPFRKIRLRMGPSFSPHCGLFVVCSKLPTVPVGEHSF